MSRDIAILLLAVVMFLMMVRIGELQKDIGQMQDSIAGLSEANKEIRAEVKHFTDPQTIQNRTFDMLFRRGEFKDRP